MLFRLSRLHLSCCLDTRPAEQEQGCEFPECSCMLFGMHITQPSAFLLVLVMPLSRCLSRGYAAHAQLSNMLS